MDTELNNKLEILEGVLRDLGSVLVAFSGGVDSGLLLWAAARVLPAERLAAATARSVLNPPGEMEAARELAAEIGVKQVVLEFDALDAPEVRSNARDRCYHCKSALAARLLETARELGLRHVAEGSHLDDAGEYRPGKRALAETGIRSPLAEAGFSKKDIRALARHLGLKNRDRPSMACLATRFPYHTALTRAIVRQVYEAEEVLADEGLAGVRARHHGDILRLEFPPELMDRIGEGALRKRLAGRLSALGFNFVTMDLAGYRSGVFDRPEEPGEAG